AVVTPDGIVGKVIAAYPTASQVVLVTDTAFAAGVISQKNRVHGILKGQGYALCRVDRVQAEEKVEPGEWFYTSGDDRVFPKGIPAGQVRVVRPGGAFQEILLDPAGLQNGIEEVLIVLEGVHEQIPELPNAAQSVHLQSPPPEDPGAAPQNRSGSAAAGTDADRLRDRYKAIGEAQGHKFGEGGPGAKPADFNAPLLPASPAAKPSAPASPGQSAPASPGQSAPAAPARPAARQ
ncbi:MAG TPA: rod shape-determining protein MreC, partial [Bryobacteraceae bacterium]|nr:rod shape-determining protein MreC [Bryobacteraceae bacterium]